MASHRRPKGTYVRNTADFFVANGAIAGGQYQGISSGTNPTVQLYNNDNFGRLFYIWGMRFTTLDDGNYNIVIQQGSPLPTVSQAQPINPLSGGPPGLFCAGEQSDTQADANLASSPWLYGAGYISDTYVFPNFPIAVIPVGYSFQLQSTIPQDLIWVTWWYTYLADQG